MCSFYDTIKIMNKRWFDLQLMDNIKMKMQFWENSNEIRDMLFNLQIMNTFRWIYCISRCAHSTTEWKSILHSQCQIFWIGVCVIWTWKCNVICCCITTCAYDWIKNEKKITSHFHFQILHAHYVCVRFAIALYIHLNAFIIWRLKAFLLFYLTFLNIPFSF